MSEAELHLIKSRMLQGLYHKAQKGELRFKLPIGYQFDDDGKIIKSLDEQITHMIDLTFQKFFELGSVHAVLRYLLEEDLLFPRKSTFDKDTRWVRPYYRAIRQVLGNPLYAGTYVFGRTKVQRELDENGNPKVRHKTQRMEDWPVVIHDHHPAYISWDQYLKIQKQIEKNTSPPKSQAGAVREGSALLQGLARCGKCGRSMSPTYHAKGKKSYPYYICNVAYRSLNQSKHYCQTIGGRRVDRAVSDAFLKALAPSSANVHLNALHQLQHQEDMAVEQLELQRERAQYEAERAFRQFDAVEPENRLVARTLEKQWNDSLRRVEEVKERIWQHKNTSHLRLSKSEEGELQRFAHNLPAIWNAPTTTDKDRKRLLQLAIKEVQLKKEDRQVFVKILWIGGAVSERIVHLPKTRSSRYTSPDMIELIGQLAQKFTDEQIARILIRQGQKTATGLTFNAAKIRSLRFNYSIPCYRKPKGQQPKTYTAEQAAQSLQVSVPTIYSWLKAGFIKGEQITLGAPWEILLTDEEIKKLTAQDAPKGWLSVSEAARELGVSKQTVHNWVKSKKLDYIYVSKGKKKGLKVHIESTTYRKQLAMFH
jgi:excisionase family DNA binding protein